VVKIAIVGPHQDKWNNLGNYTLLQAENIVKAEVYKIFQSHAIKTKREYSEYCIEYEYDYSNIIFVSGHCPKGGVDIWAESIADSLCIKKEIFTPEVNQWEDKMVVEDKGTFDDNCKMFTAHRAMGYKSRNIKIAETCDILYCIVPFARDSISVNQTHCTYCEEYGHWKNGGCWTKRTAKKLGKETHLIVID
jgi:hypothetical protein